MTSIRGSVVAAVIVGGLGLAGLAIGIDGLAEVESDRDWIQVRATVLDVVAVPYEYTGTRGGGGSYQATGTRVKTKYAYSVDGKAYEGTRYSRFEEHDDYGSSTEEEAQQRFATLKKTGSVDVWYDPSDPSLAVLARAPEAPAIAVTFAGAILLTVACGIFFAAIKRRRDAEALAALDVDDTGG